MSGTGEEQNSTPPCPWGAPVIGSPAWGSPLVTAPQQKLFDATPNKTSFDGQQNNSMLGGQFDAQNLNAPSHLQTQQRHTSSPRGRKGGHQQFTPQRNNFPSPSFNSPSPQAKPRFNGHSNGGPSPHRHQQHSQMRFGSSPRSNNSYQKHFNSNNGFQSPDQNGGSPRHRFQNRGPGQVSPNFQSSGFHFNPRAYVNPSMLEDPWKDLPPTPLMKSY